MKKFFLLLLIPLLFMTGCTIKQVNNKDIKSILDTLLGKDLNLYNQTSKGYKYYVPRGVSVIDNTSYNEKLIATGDVYYLYIDAVSYQYKKINKYTESKKIYYYKDFEYNKKTGYLSIKKIDNIYYIEMYYNYAKIEAVVEKDNINKTIINSCYILNSLKFNKIIIKNIFSETANTFAEQQWALFKPKKAGGNYLNYVKEYNQYEKNIDEDLITTDSGNTTDNIVTQ